MAAAAGAGSRPPQARLSRPTAKGDLHRATDAAIGPAMTIPSRTGLDPDASRRAQGRALPSRPAGGAPDPLGHLDRLEAEAIHILREVAAVAERPVLLYSVGKDSSVLLHLAARAFYPGPIPFPLLHVESGWDFAEVLAHRDEAARRHGARLLVHRNAQAAAEGVNPFDTPVPEYTRRMLTETLTGALDAHGFTAAIGGARRDEDRARAKERVFSFRAPGHRWDPKAQRPEMWRLWNARVRPGETVRVFPLSDWTEADVWAYIAREQIPLVPLYFAKPRPVVRRGDLLLVVDDPARYPFAPGERPAVRMVRFRTLGCWPLTGAIESAAETLEAVIAETLSATVSERAGRAVDHDSAASMERKKREGYF